MKLTKALASMLVLCLLAGCAEHLSWNQRLTIVLQTPEGPLKFSAVQAVELETTTDFYDSLVSGIAGPDGYKYHIHGQAPYFKLPTGQIVVALIMGSGSHDGEPGRMALTHLGDPSIRGPENDDTARAAFEQKERGVSVEIPRADWPYIIVIPQDGDIASLRPVNGQVGEPLETLVGAGYAVEAVEIEKTNDAVDPITIESVVPCLGDQTPYCQFDRLSREVRTPFNSITMRSFVRRDLP
ncbi:MAG: hypothetical protein AAFY06_00895 [Pseudomonadota bacterium]